ncbi:MULTISPECIES: DUF3149 domain-containing protein [Agarivorans]|uniref:Membrane protein n=1 Tax=Agarivorans gilvus TaxID=680279 RepID=A0ABQ1I2F2_9ALTE|nr:DUF3149 domain-containing protein [Agarivorans gilvus]GGB09810.1 membrane protein [Agarivorans gilvus]
MDLWLDLLFGNSIGLMSIGVITCTIALMIFYSYYFIKKIRQSDDSHK